MIYYCCSVCKCAKTDKDVTQTREAVAQITEYGNDKFRCNRLEETLMKFQK